MGQGEKFYQISINTEFLPFQYGTATIVMFYFITNPISPSLSVIKPGHFRSIYDYEHPCEHWKADADDDFAW